MSNMSFWSLYVVDGIANKSRMKTVISKKTLAERRATKRLLKESLVNVVKRSFSEKTLSEKRQGSSKVYVVVTPSNPEQTAASATVSMVLSEDDCGVYAFSIKQKELENGLTNDVLCAQDVSKH
jgi:hypothetical protein